MALAPNAIVTLADFRSFYGVAVTQTDQKPEMEATVGRASRWVENHLGRRVIYRATIESAANIVAQVAMTAGALSVVQPTAPRTLVVDVIDAARALTAGTLTIIGTAGGVTVTRVLDVSAPGRQHVPEFFSAITSATLSGLAGQGAATLIRIGTSLGYVEYQTGPRPSTLLLDWPLIQVASVYDDDGSPRTYGSAYLLTAGTDYDLSIADGGICRLYSGEPYSWSSYRRGVKVTYSAGYTLATVPDDIRGATLKLCSLFWKEQDRKTFGISGQTDGAGNWSRNAPPELTRDIRDMLEPHRMGAWADRHGERPDYDLEAC